MTLPLLLLLPLLLPSGTLSAAAPEAAPLVVALPSGAGSVSGFKLPGYRAWRGIPYAAPPTGTNRWRPPQPVAPWAPKTLDATTYKPNCLQPSPPCWYSIHKTKESSEDCLYVDVYVPDAPTQSVQSAPSGLAVMVWIHGGDYQYGGSDDGETERPPWASEAGVIYVSVNYRLSVFGYLGSEHLRARDATTPRSTGNYGAQDQRAAIRWAKTNIAAFGGDPDRIAIFGESAGAGSVTVQTVMPRSFGLFERAITESGGFSQWVAKEMPRAEDNYAWVMKNMGLKPHEVDKLVTKSAHEILNAAQYWMPGCPWPDTMVQSQFAPVIDGVELTAHPSVLAAAGQVAPNVDVIFGSNRDEGTMFVSDNNYTHKQGHYSGANLPLDIDEAQFHDFAFGSWGAIVGRMLSEQNVYPLKCSRPRLEYERCPIGTYNTWWWAATRATGDFMMTCTARRAARQWASFGHDAYNYYFSHTPVFSVNTYPTAPWGAFHGSEVPFVWGAEFELTGVAEVALSKKMVSYWSNFAKHGNPNGKKTSPVATTLPGGDDDALPHWPRLVTNVSDGMIRLATGDWRPYTRDFERANVSAVEGLRKAECDFWDIVNGFVVNPLPLAQRRQREAEEEALHGEAAPAMAATGRMLRAQVDADDGDRVDRTSPPALVTAASWTTTASTEDGALQEMPTPRSNFGTATVGRHMIFAVGGLAAKQPGSRARVHEDSAAVEVFNTKKEKWLRGPPLRKPRSGLGVVAVRDGGDTIKENGEEEEEEEEEAGKDRIGIGGERRRSKTTTRLFAVGGMYGEGVHFFAVPYVEVLDVTTHRDGSLVRGNDDSDGDEEKALRRRKWKRIADLPANRTELSLVVVQGRVYAIGGAGATKTGSTDSMWSLPLFGEDGKSLLTMEQQRAARWRKEPSMPTPRASITSGSLDGKIIVAGGMRGFLASALDPDPLNTVEVFDPATRTWTSAPSAAAATATISPSGNKPEQLPQAVHSPGSVVAPKGLFGKGAGKVLVVGGGYASTGDVGAVFGLKESAHGTWAALPPLTVPRMGLALAATQDCLYAIGGMTQDPAQHASMNAASPITASVEKFCPKEGGRTRISRGEEEDDEL